MGDPKRFWKESVGVVSRRTETGAPSKDSRATAPPALPAPEGATATGLLPIEQVLSALPFGSILFAEQVARTLWTEPSPSDLKALAVIVERRRGILAGVQRDSVLCCVQLRLRVQRLLARTTGSVGDPRPFQLPVGGSPCYAG